MQQTLNELARQIGQILTTLFTFIFNGYYLLVSAALANLWAIVMLGAGLIVLRIMRKHANLITRAQ